MFSSMYFASFYLSPAEMSIPPHILTLNGSYNIIINLWPITQSTSASANCVWTTASSPDMTPMQKTYNQEASVPDKRKGKRKADELDEDGQGDVSGMDLKKKRNKQRVLLLSSRGITHRMRHLMNDLEALLPHVKKGVCVRIGFCSFTRVIYPLLLVKC
jgi:hypothetical protein